DFGEDVFRREVITQLHFLAGIALVAMLDGVEQRLFQRQSNGELLVSRIAGAIEKSENLLDRRVDFLGIPHVRGSPVNRLAAAWIVMFDDQLSNHLNRIAATGDWSRR